MPAVARKGEGLVCFYVFDGLFILLTLICLIFLFLRLCLRDCSTSVEILFQRAVQPNQ